MSETVEIKRIQYSYNSLLMGQGPYSLQAFIMKDGETLVNTSETFETLDQFYQKIEELIPLFGVGEVNENESREKQAEDERWLDSYV